MDANIKEVTTDQWLDLMMERWKQGQHITLIGETGSGKTALASSLLDIRSYVVVLAVKKSDDTLMAFEQEGYKIIKKWPPTYTDKRVILWAKPTTLDDIPRQRVVLMRALESMYASGGWTVFLDDLTYIFNFLKIKLPVGILLNQGRSSKLTLVSAVTRPVGVLRDNFVQATYHVVFPFEDDRDIAIIGQITGKPKKYVVEWMQELAPHDFLAFDRVRRDVLLVRNTH